MSIKELLHYTRNLNILYVEDEEISQELYASIFGDLFLNVDIASDGVEALKYFSLNKYDMIITDVCMPRMDGVELCKKILKSNPEQLVIIMSAYNESEQLNDISDLGVSSILLKPIQNDDLMSTLEKVSKIAFSKQNK